ncbi:MAG: hypothetical protein GTO02_22270 [Candidatus Dadabacteria bacterium]|nr:hypothetical protein [Candidatus Dadabacteria bacterium]NIQ17006.1 hypothetical protein [Candidatus Dadabacteria bacterium]
MEWFLIGGAIIMGIYLFNSFNESPKNMHDVYGSGFVLLCFIFGYIAFYEKSEFNFNKISRQLTWSRKRFLKKSGGIVSFHNIKNVIFQNSKGGDTSSNVRVVLVTDSEKIPMTTAYLGNDNICILVAKKIRHTIKFPDRDIIMESVKEMVKNNQTIDAIRLLRIDKGMSLNEAKQEIENIKANF